MRKLGTKKFLLMLGVFCFLGGGFIYASSVSSINRPAAVSKQKVQKTNLNAYSDSLGKAGLKVIDKKINKGDKVHLVDLSGTLFSGSSHVVDPTSTGSDDNQPLTYYNLHFRCSDYDPEPWSESYPIGEIGYLPYGDWFCDYSYNHGYVGQPNTYQGGLKFKGWKLVSSNIDPVESDAIEFSNGAAVYNLGGVGEDVYLRGVWESSPTYTVKYDCNGGAGYVDGKGYPFTIGQAERLMTISACKKDGYYFVGWSTSPTSTTPMYGPAEYVKDLGAAGSEVTLYAVYDHTGVYGVIYNCNGGHDKKMGGLNARASYFPVGDGGYLSSNSCWKPRSTFVGWKTASSDVVYPDGSYFSDSSKQHGKYTFVKAVWNDL